MKYKVVRISKKEHAGWDAFFAYPGNLTNHNFCLITKSITIRGVFYAVQGEGSSFGGT